MVDPEIGARLRQAREDAGFEHAVDACRRFNWVVDTYRSHENGNRGIKLSTLKTYAKAYKVSFEWLSTGRAQQTGIEQPSVVDKIRVPKVNISNLPARRGELGQAILTMRLDETVPAPMSRVLSEDFAVDLIDESMVEAGGGRWSLWPGDTVFVSPQQKPKPGGLALAYNPETASHHVRKVRELPGGMIELYPLNADFAAFALPADSEHILGTVVAFNRSTLG